MKIRLRFLCIFTSLLFLTASHFSVQAATNYEPGKTFGENDSLISVSGITTTPSGQLLVASGNEIFIYNTQTSTLSGKIKTTLTGISAIASEGDQVYALSTQTKNEEMTYQGRIINRKVPTGVLCKKYSMTGSELGQLSLQGLKDATNAKIHNHILYVSDYAQRTIFTFNLSSGMNVRSISNNVRLCCGIFDFCLNPKTNKVLIANLGAFQVMQEGASSGWGKRGTADSDFQGCCNPVSVAYLSDGNIVTAEKDPSRVKVYDASGKYLSTFPNLTSLVRGCHRVCMAVDSNDAVYLGVNGARRYVVQYVPQKTTATSFQKVINVR